MQLTKEQADVYEAEVNDNIVVTMLKKKLEYQGAFCDELNQLLSKLDIEKNMVIADVFVNKDHILIRPLNRDFAKQGFDGFLLNTPEIVEELGSIELFKKLMYFVNYVERLTGKSSKAWDYFLPTTGRACNVDKIVEAFSNAKIRPFEKL